MNNLEQPQQPEKSIYEQIKDLEVKEKNKTIIESERLKLQALRQHTAKQSFRN